VDPAGGAGTADPGAACLIGQWHQTEGWQRLDVRADPLELHLVTGGADFTITAAGTGTVAYPAPSVWRGATARHELAATFTGSASFTYTALAGAWTAVADNTKITTSLTLDGTRDEPRAGTAGRATTGTYQCTPSDLIISTDTTRDAYTRA
jgi:hypothetical protein